jgi:4-hydroxybenzoate polyprenyltransferase
MGIVKTIKEYGKLARSFNMALTGMGPVFGALAMFETSPWRLLTLFILGCGAHIFGFVLNDYIDARIDKHSDELSERPLVSGTITPGKALAFATFGLFIMLFLGLLLIWPNVLPAFLILLLAGGSSTFYNLVSKRAPGMDVFVAGAVGLLTLFGSSTVTMNFTPFAYNMALLAFLQVMFMNIVAGGLKDIDHDYKAGGRNLAIAMGCKVIQKKKDKLVIPMGFKALAHGIELAFLICVLLPWVFNVGHGVICTCCIPSKCWNLPGPYSDVSIQLVLVIVLGIAMMAASTKLMGMKQFIRPKMRKFIGLHYALNFSLVPVMLSVIHWWIALFALIPPLGFALANLALHGEAAAPKTM